MSMSYNGWPTKETWHISLVVECYDDVINCQEMLEDCIANFGDQQNYVVADLLRCALERVDWEYLKNFYQ